MPTEPSPTLRTQLFSVWGLAYHPALTCAHLHPGTQQTLFSWLPRMEPELILRGCPFTYIQCVVCYLFCGPSAWLHHREGVP